MFKKAVKHESKLRLAIAGPSGSGKTYTALAIGTALGKVAVVDTESGSASKYADIFDFDVAEMHAPFHPRKYAEAIAMAADAGYDVVILDSLSHAWFAQGGVLDIVDEAAKRSRSGNTYMAWKEGTPAQNQLVEAIVTAPIHVIGTMRSKTEYALVTNDRGKQEPRKMGMAPIQRDGFEYEFDVMFDMDVENTAVVSKSRCSALANKVIAKPGADVAGVLQDWLSGEPAPRQEPQDSGTYSDRFLTYCVDNIDRYTNIHAVRAALKKQYPTETGDRREQMTRFEWLKQPAAERDAEEAGVTQDEIPGLDANDTEELADYGAYAE